MWRSGENPSRGGEESWGKPRPRVAYKSDMKSHRANVPAPSLIEVLGGAPPASDPSARVATALRSTVRAQGSDVVRFLFEAYGMLEAAFFSKRLPEAMILLSPPGSPRALGDHVPLDEHGLRYRIRIAPKSARRGELFLVDVLLHEMVHVWRNAEDPHDREKGYRGHGPKFAAECNRIGAMMGLPTVEARGDRKGVPDCSTWPVCVRPAGYYGEEEEAPKRKAAPANDGDGDGGDRDSEAASALERAKQLVEQLDLDECAALLLCVADQMDPATGIAKDVRKLVKRSLLAADAAAVRASAELEARAG